MKRIWTILVYLFKQTISSSCTLQYTKTSLHNEMREAWNFWLSSSSKCCIFRWNLQICAAAWIWALGTVPYNRVSQLKIHKFSKFTTSVHSFHQNTQFSLPNVSPKLSFIAITIRKTTFRVIGLIKVFIVHYL